MKVGFIGLGVMGLPMAINLVKGGHDVTGFNRSPGAMRKLEESGGHVADNMEGAARGMDVVFTVLPDSPDVETAVREHLAEAMPRDSLYIDCSTISPKTTMAMGVLLKKRGVRMLDAALGRSAKEAVAGTLMFMVGGAESDLAEARPLLELMGNKIIHCGPLGAGISTKIVNNYAGVTINTVVAETLNLGEALGCDREMLIEIMQNTNAGTRHLSNSYPLKVLAGDLTPAFALKHASKDLGIALESGAWCNTPLFTGAAASQAYTLARAEGFGDKDWTSMLEVIRLLGGAKAKDGK